jgi:hypothetical protein
MMKRIACILILLLAQAYGESDGQSGLPLIQEGDITYLGSFALPQGTYGETRFGYGGRAITPYNDPATGKNTLFLEGHDWDSGSIAQIEIPKSFSNSSEWTELPKASVLQDFADIGDGKWETLGTESYVAVFGMLPYGNRLIVAATSWYDASCSQRASHGASSFDLSLADDFTGFKSIEAEADARSLGGYMTMIPEEWQESFGGPVLTGNSALSIISCISSGPAATVIDPAEIGVSELVGRTLVYYPLSHYLHSGDKTDENTWTFGSTVRGIAFPPGTRSVLFIGIQTLADGYCYGPGTDDITIHKTPAAGGTWCFDLCSDSKGGHGYPYVHYVWAYDAEELLEAANGEKEPWEVLPYDTWELQGMDDSGCAGMRGAGFDPSTGRLYITQSFGEQGKVDVFEIGKTCVSAQSLLSRIASWKSGSLSLRSLMESIRKWKQGC